MIRLKPVLTAILLLASAGASYAATGNTLEPASGPTYVVADARDVVYDEATGTIARSSDGECIRTQWMDNHDACANQVVETQTVVAQISREDRTVYFGFNQATLTPDMKARLDTLATNLRSESRVKDARIVGYADRIGNSGYNEKLSKKRAETVKNYLVSKGLINTQVADTRWFGANEPATSCPSDLKRPELIECLQKDRRVEVEVDYTPDVRASR